MGVEAHGEPQSSKHRPRAGTAGQLLGGKTRLDLLCPDAGQGVLDAGAVRPVLGERVNPELAESSCGQSPQMVLRTYSASWRDWNLTVTGCTDRV